MAKEIELKYRATPAVLEQLQAAFPGDYREISMQTTYFDNKNRDFSRSRWTLRHRQENNDHICTLKTLAENNDRNEFEVECPDIHQAIGVLAAESGIAALPQMAADLLPVCGARFTRRALTLQVGSAVVELALDSGVLLGGGQELPFVEVEAELKTGDRQTLEAFGAALTDRFGLTIEPKSKFARAKELAEENHGI